MLTKELYTKGSRVWVPHPELVWEGAEVVEDYQSSILKVRTEAGTIKQFNIPSDSDLPPLRNPDILIGENDLTSLSYLHEPAVLYNLQVRFCLQQAIYTYCGIVLVAINPYTELPIYDIDTVWAYRGQAMGDLEPHIFAVAEEAFTKMEREQRDQSIIVSGESGAGKTVSAKYAMRYFATVGGSATETHVEKKVLASSPIMEAIGNAKTTRNDNSSRFGKFIELQFSKSYNIIGASMRTYLLEKSRVVFQAPEERNYHIFYQLCSARSDYPYLKLSEPSVYKYLGEPSVIPGVDDAQAFQETQSALSTLGFTDIDKDDVLKILAAVLHLGNIKIVEGSGPQGDSEGSSISETDSHLFIVADLLQLNIKQLKFWLCHRRIVSMKEVFDKPMTILEAVCARDSLAKYIYAELFSYIVSVINTTLEKASENRYKFIGVLDIYGFETFETNSFEQFCINYANEKLQQQFNQHVFKLEQEEYLKEEIEWKFIDFYDNQPCIDLIEAKLGILDLLDEECRMPKGSDNTWAEKLYAKCLKWQHFEKPRFGTNAFVIKHFADKVEYDVAGFLEKNRDKVVEELMGVIRNGGNLLVQRLFKDPEAEKKLAAPATMPRTRVPYSMRSTSATVGATSKHKKSVGSQFRDSLNALMATLNSTTPHYIRCIKPNDDKKAFEYNAPRAVQQLRACGVLETIRISAAGFPSRWLYVDFFNRYRVLCHSKDIHRNNLKMTCDSILTNIIKDTDKYKFGKTKIFFRAGQVAYLERLRAERLRHCCLIIQKNIRGFLHRRRYLKIQKSARCLQRYSRGLLARRYANGIRRNKAAVTIQRHVRGWVERTKYKRKKYVILRLQTRSRGLLARRKFMELRYNHAATIIGRHVKGWLCRRWYQKQRRHVVVCQNSIRRFLARKTLKKLKIEARSVEKVKQLNKGLENKIINLQQRIEELLKENAALKNLQPEVSELKLKLEHLRSVEGEFKKQTALMAEREATLSELITELEKERGQKMDILCEKEELQEEFEKVRNDWNNKKNNLELEISSLKEENRNNKINAEKMLQMKVEEEKLFWIKEHEEDTIAYQKLVAEKNYFETQYDHLSEEIVRLKSGHTRSLSDASTISGGTDENHEEGVDIGILLKLQQKIRALENEKDRLHLLLEAKYDSITDHKVQDDFKLQQLEMDNSKLKTDLHSLRKLVSEGTFVNKETSDELMKQFEAMQAEMTRMREESVQLKSVLASKTQGIKNIASTNYASSDVNLSLINEDGELVLAFEAQKKINRQLEDELKANERTWSIEKAELLGEISRVMEDNERQQKLLASNLTKSPQSQNEAFLRHEITRITNENLRLHEERDVLLEQIRTLNGQYKDIRRHDGIVTVNERSLVESQRKPAIVVPSDKLNNPVVRKKEAKANFMGMFEFRKEDDVLIIKRLVHDLKPTVAVNLLPGLPAYILFMCIRHTDFINDDEKVRSILIGYINMVKKVIRKRQNDLDSMVLWFSNTLRLLHNLKQYSGDKTFKDGNTRTQNEQCLRNFDLSEYRQVMSDTAVWIYQGVIRCTEGRITQKVVPAILEHEEIPGMSGGMRPRGPSLGEAPVTLQKSLDSLLTELSTFHRTVLCHAVDPEIVVQIFTQLFYYICAVSLNQLLLRKDLCRWSKGMQIRYNLSHLEQWAKDHKLQNPEIVDKLNPITEASQLLQARKSDDDVDTVCQMCTSMLPDQIIKLLKTYTPDGFEERVSVSFITKVTKQLKEQKDSIDKPVLMDTKFNFPVRFPFNPSNIRLEDVEIPEVLNLPMLKKV